MAVNYGLDFSIFYACALVLFSYLAFWYVPIAVKAGCIALRNWVQRSKDRPADPLDGDHVPNEPASTQLWWQAHSFH